MGDFVAPLDAYSTAKPSEPTWTVQGGDPLGAPLLRVWALFARIQAERIPEQDVNYIFEQLCRAAKDNPPEDNKRDDLLIRATETEQISWLMDEYRKGIAGEEQQSITQFNEFDRLDIYDLRQKASSLISAFFSNLGEYCEELAKHKWLTPELNDKIIHVVSDLRAIMDELDIKRK